MNIRQVSSLLCAAALSSGLLLGNTWDTVVTCGNLQNPYLYHVDTVQLPSGSAQGLSFSSEYGPPVAVAITPDATKALVVFQGYFDEQYQGNAGVAFFDLTQPITTLMDFVDLSYYLYHGESLLTSIAITPDGTTAVVVDNHNDMMFVIDVAHMTVVGYSPPYFFSDDPSQVAITPDGTMAVVTNNGTSVSIVYLPTPAVLYSIPVVNAQTGVAVTPDGTKALVVENSGLVVIDLDLMSVTATIPLSAGSKNIAISSDGTLALVTGDAEVTAIDLGTLSVIGYPISLGEDVLGNVAITPDGRQAIVTGTSGSSVYALDLTQLSQLIDGSSTGISLITVDETPNWCSITPDQAPTARFTFTAQGDKFFFDGSASTSPVGGIASYIWDFGDGSSRTTTTPEVSHTYSGIGPFTVTLTVVNDGGTSLDVTFTGQTMSNNGGPSARISQVVAGFSRPSKFLGRVHRSHHGRSVLTTWWPKKRNTKEYQLFAHDKKIASIRGSHKCEKKITLHSEDSPFSRKYRHRLHHKYKIRAVDAYGRASPFTALRIK